MRPDPSRLLEIAGIELPLIGFYDAPDPDAFAPLVAPEPTGPGCAFAFYPDWLRGATLHLTPRQYGCGGAARSWCGVEGGRVDDLVRFLVDEEGLKASRELMTQWIKQGHAYKPRHGHILVGPLRDDHYEHLRSVTFLANPDQIGLLATAAQYHSAPSDPPPVLAPFGSGCSQMVAQFHDLDKPQAVIGATDIAMRQHLPPDVMTFSVTKPLYEQMCALDEKSFLYKPFWRRLRAARSVT